MNDEPKSPFKYHLELTPAQLKVTHTALHALLNDFGHEQPDVHRVIREVLDKLPDEHAMRAIKLETEIERENNGENGPPAVLEAEPPASEDPEDPDPSAA